MGNQYVGETNRGLVWCVNIFLIYNCDILKNAEFENKNQI
jgi:hypothetical protein